MKKLAGILAALFMLLVVGLLCANAIASAAEPITTLHPDGTVTPAPLSAIAVSQCGLAVALFIQLDATYLLRADPRQSDLYAIVDGKQRLTSAAPMKWADAYALAQKAALSTHVVLPCTDGPQV